MSLTEPNEILLSLGMTRIPDNLHDGIMRYIAHGIQPGSFLTAVMANDLTESFARADMHSRATLFFIVEWLYQHCPITARGSNEAVRAWIDMHQQRREQQRQESQS